MDFHFLAAHEDQLVRIRWVRLRAIGEVSVITFQNYNVILVSRLKVDCTKCMQTCKLLINIHL